MSWQSIAIFFSHIQKQAVFCRRYLRLSICLLCVVWPLQFQQATEVGIFHVRLVTQNYAENERRILILLVQYFVCGVRRIAMLTNRSSADGPPSGTLMSSLCKSWGTLSNACGPCGKPIGPANDPNEPANVGIGCGVNGICWACICCCTNWKRNGMTKQFKIWDSFSCFFWTKYWNNNYKRLVFC